MTTRSATLSDSPGVRARTPAALPVRRAALWALLGAKLLAGWGVRWDIQWHLAIGRDSFWIAPHLMTYTGVALVVLVSFGVLAWETGQRTPGTLRLLGLRGTRGFHVAAWGIAITVLAAPIDDLWHRLFGLDVTLWSPPHLLGFVGAAVNSLGCLLIAREVYPEGSRRRLAAMVVAGAWLYGALHPTLEPATLVAYRHGGVAFHTYAVLAALVLPLALVPTTRLSGHRWTPVWLLAVVLLAGIAGDAIAQAGFAWLRPVPAIEEAIAQDPDSPIALAHEIARKNGRDVGPGRLAARPLALLPGVVMAVVDARRRPRAATLAYAAVVFGLTAWVVGAMPAFRPLVPSTAETALALGVTLVAALVSAAVAERLADRLRGQSVTEPGSSCAKRTPNPSGSATVKSRNP
jgi:hypothetical protein